MIPKVWLSVLLATLLAAPRVVAQQGGPPADLVDATTRFAFKFFRQTVANDPDGNALSAPMPLMLDFALLQNGAGNVARDEIRSVFEFRNLEPREINEQSLALRQALSYPQPRPVGGRRRFGSAPPPFDVTPPDERLTFARSLWTQPGAHFRPSFLAINRRFYSLQTRNISGRGQAAVAEVNGWVAQQTGGRLTQVLDSWKGDDFLLVDTTWFKAVWETVFLGKFTHPGDFTLPGGRRKQVSMMAQSGNFAYLRGEKFQAVRLPYQHAAMYVFLPDEDSSLQQFEQLLTPENWAAWMQSLQDRPGDLELPRFRTEYRGNATKILLDLGLKHVFAPHFTAFAPAVSNREGAALTRVLQVITISVDENGTEVASAGIAGGVIGGVAGGPRPAPFHMIVNRPFFFAICNSETHAIVYLGAINEP